MKKKRKKTVLLLVVTKRGGRTRQRESLYQFAFFSVNEVKFNSCRIIKGL